jgi:uncharacterized membrane protein YraQ (UPF0718 family)
MALLTFVGHWLAASAAMLWQVLWSLLAGFILSAMIQAYVPKGGLRALLGRAGIREIATAAALGAASSSCSYAAAATARSLFLRGADFTVAMVFMFASTNLVIELGLALWQLMGWPFVLAEWLGGILLIAVFVLLARIFLPAQVTDAARSNAVGDEGAGCPHHGHGGSHEGAPADHPAGEADPHRHDHDHGDHHHHDHGDMLAPGTTLWEKLRSRTGWTYVSHYFRMDVSMLRDDLVLGFLIAGFLAVVIPPSWWRHLFAVGLPGPARAIENALVGPLVAVLSFVCSIGNVPLAAVLWNSGSTFGGVVAFLYADLIVIPLLDVYRKYYGWALAARMAAVFYASMVVAGLLVEMIFAALNAIPQPSGAFLARLESVRFDATTVLNILFIAAALALAWVGRTPASRKHAATVHTA